jgi:hypothetical protein
VELTLFKDSALVFIAPLHQTEKLKQISMNQYMRTDTVDKDISSSLLTVNKIQDHLLSINLKLTKSNQAGDKKETWIIAKP